MESQEILDHIQKQEELDKNSERIELAKNILKAIAYTEQEVKKVENELVLKKNQAEQAQSYLSNFKEGRRYYFGGVTSLLPEEKVIKKPVTYKEYLKTSISELFDPETLNGFIIVSISGFIAWLLIIGLFTFQCHVVFAIFMTLVTMLATITGCYFHDKAKES